MRIRHAGIVVAFMALCPAFAAAVRADEGPRTRHYYLTAEEGLWDFAPSRQSVLHEAGHGARIPAPWTNNTVKRKVRYIEYTDDTFTTKKAQPEWLGVLGPVLRAEVGDILVVHFLNRARGHYGIHPHGLRYTKEHEGALYPGAGPGARLAPGQRFTYTWTVDEGAGPGPADPSSLVWWYHSHVDEPAETNLGLLGPIIVTARGQARPDATPVDVDREFVLLFMVFNENATRDSKAERGLMHAINGYIFGNLPGLVMRSGETVRWYLLGMGEEMDLHTAHWHGKTLSFRGRHTDVVELLPGSMATADMVADNPGTWLLHCHVGDHMHAGMMATYTIQPP